MAGVKDRLGRMGRQGYEEGMRRKGFDQVFDEEVVLQLQVSAD